MLTVPGFKGTNAPMPSSFLLIAGPCVVENDRTPREIATAIKTICSELDIPFIFKASYRKANRSRGDSFTGIGDIRALKILRSIGEDLELALITDIHSSEEADIAAEYVDVLQIPAFLCRQTDLLIAAAKTGKWVNIKKGQFLSPEAMQFAVDKVTQYGNSNVWITERGSSFGYQDLVVDMRSIPIMRKFAPVIVDCTHSLQKPNQTSGITGGNPELIQTIARAAVAVGADGLFIETHPRPREALSDGSNMLPLSELKNLLRKAHRIFQAVNSHQ